MVEVRSHPATDDFGVPEVNGSGEGKSCRHAERCRRADDRADVAGVLDGISTSRRNGLDAGKVLAGAVPGPRRLPGCPAASRSRPRCEVFGTDLVDGYLRRSEPLEEARAARSVSPSRGRDERAANDQRRAKQLLDAADAFGDEQPLSLAGLAALQVAGEGEESSWPSGMCLAFAEADSYMR